MPRKVIKLDDGIIRREIRDFILANFLPREKAATLGDTDLLFESGIIDSAGAMTLIAHIEKRFGLRTPDEELFPENFATIKKTVAYISVRLNGSKTKKPREIRP